MRGGDALLGFVCGKTTNDEEIIRASPCNDVDSKDNGGFFLQAQIKCNYNLCTKHTMLMNDFLGSFLRSTRISCDTLLCYDSRFRT